MDKFLDAYNEAKLNQDDIKHLISSITCNEIKVVIKSLLTKKRPGDDGFTAKFYQIYKEELNPKFPKLFQEIERELIPKPNKDVMKREPNANIFNE
jgi:hypothetical protein